MIPLIAEYPRLEKRLPRVALGIFPTPVEEARRLGSEIGVARLFMKRDDLSGPAYGGNKVRKLEFLLAQARREQADTVLTFGCAGSNHALATTLYARQLGMKSIVMLMPQAPALYVRRNLLMDAWCGAELHCWSEATEMRRSTMYRLADHRVRFGSFPFVIPPGGTTPVGTIGFVNAAFELREQIRQGLLPEPDVLYVALGTMGTAAGLILGLAAAKLRTRVVAVRVVPDWIANQSRCLHLLRQTNELLCRLDPSFPRITFSELDIDVRDDFFGEQYGLFTREGTEAVDVVEKAEGLKLEGTYTGKAFAALIGEARAGMLRDQTVLFWNTHNSRAFPESALTFDYRLLPPPLHSYFEGEVQPLDRGGGG
jgi:1-aminocyclopropane-1-carboxylate deaminase/D-cysteine desulfhydrase-like pyridoxal-dependent ACC family enzyme